MYPIESAASEYRDGMHTKRVVDERAELPDPVKQALSRVVWPLVTSVATTIVMAYNRRAILDNRTTIWKKVRTTANNQSRVAIPTSMTTRACGWAMTDPLNHDGSVMRCSRSTRKPSRVPTTQRPAGPPQKIQEYWRFHQIAVTQASA